MRVRPRRQILIGAGLAGLGTMGLLWELVQSPLVYILALSLVGGAVATKVMAGSGRTIAFNIALFAGLLLPLEAYFAYRDRQAAPTAQPPALALDDPLPVGISTALPSDPKWVLTENRSGLSVYQAGGRLVKLHRDLGWIHRPGARIGERMYRGEQILFDTVYNIDVAGLRVTSNNPPPEANAETVIFLGCSFTFGQGLADRETIASAFARAAGGHYQVQNWGISGAGPHSLLAHFETSQDRQRLAGRQVPFAVYVAIRHHLRRIVGDTHFSAYYPRYTLADGALVRDGQFPPQKTLSQLDLSGALRFEAQKSHLLAHLIARLPSAVGWSDDAAAGLFLRLVGETARLLKERYGAELLVVLWDDFGPEQEFIEAGLTAAGIRTWDQQTVFPDFSPERHYLPFYDHPSAAATQQAADFLVGQLLPGAAP